MITLSIVFIVVSGAFWCLGREIGTFCVEVGDIGISSGPVAIIVVMVLLFLFDFVTTEAEGCTVDLFAFACISPSLLLVYVDAFVPAV